ncbi:helix-turn-helix transcriptional regulator [Paracoccus aestuariivivens]|uniref:LuxR family transcriptional regulator n=1 Tax=Paracoccus aestuariivivens TaxID=1820333 RepID=A0A6L6JD50_9RHOB|nr:LuxR family transcriptional regulator [Paracoccus aestuariivivens]MTH79446.1 LuxR family transcriptional regulator [Paracoccus aestuariivivens]
MLETVIPDHDALISGLEDLAPSGFFLGLGFKLGRPVTTINRFPEAWVSRWEQDIFVSRDPIALWIVGQPRESAARWSEIAANIPDDFGIFEAARKYGLRYGAAFVTITGRRRSCLSVARPDCEYSDAELSLLAGKLDLLAHLYAQNMVTLSEKEIEGLRQIRLGLSHAEAAESLSISVSALKLRLSSAQKKLGCRNVTAAVVRAVEEDLI